MTDAVAPPPPGHRIPAAPSPSPASAAISGAWSCAARCSSCSRSASIASGSRPTCGGICGRIPRSSGDAPEYTGTAKELLIGFLFALAILAPIYLAYFFIGLEAELYQAFASIPLILFFYLFYQFAMYRARRYRLSRTIWRGVRFWMKGSGWAYAWRAGLWMLLVDRHARAGAAVVPGRARTLQDAATASMAICPAASTAPAGGLFKQVWWLWLRDVS